MARYGYYYSNYHARSAMWMFLVFGGVIALARKVEGLTFGGVFKQIMLALYEQRYVISVCLVIVFATYIIYHHIFAEPRFKNAEEYVLFLEKQRILKEYKPGWLYYQCRSLGLLDTLERLRVEGKIPQYQRQNPEREESQVSAQAESDDPYRILNIANNASIEEIKRAYRDAVKLYHPDKVHALGPMLQEVAKKMTTAINAAYEELLSRHAAKHTQ